ncbi:MAG TPA: hypothetical protein VFS33_05765 [Gemmatimonadales bacterium]|nr:hypothetical protein [Gemmatimonadales bacterium]
MGRRPNARQRASQRRNDARAAAVALPPGLERAPRVPLAGFEAHYEITRDGYVYARRLGRFVQHAWFEGRRYIQLQIAGVPHKLDIAEAAARSWAQAPGRLVRVEIPATTFVVVARDEREAVQVALTGLGEEIRDGRVTPEAHVITHEAAVPSDWLDAVPYAAADLAEAEEAMEDRTVRERLHQNDAGAEC